MLGGQLILSGGPSPSDTFTDVSLWPGSWCLQLVQYWLLDAGCFGVVHHAYLMIFDQLTWDQKRHIIIDVAITMHLHFIHETDVIT